MYDLSVTTLNLVSFIYRLGKKMTAAYSIRREAVVTFVCDIVARYY